MMAAILNSTILDFILTQLDDGSHSAILDSATATLDSDTLLFSQIHSKTLSLHSDSDWN